MVYCLSCLQWSRYDDVLEKFLQSMELEDRLALRLVYITSLPPLLEAAGLRMCRWSKRLLRVCGSYLEVAGYCAQKEAQYALLVRQLVSLVCKVKPPCSAWLVMDFVFEVYADAVNLSCWCAFNSTHACMLSLTHVCMLSLTHACMRAHTHTPPHPHEGECS